MSVLRRFTNLFRRSAMDRDIADELQSHIDLRIESNLAKGMSPADARREALLRFGNRTATKEHVTASDTTLSLAGLTRDIRYASRQLRRSPGFALTAIVTLALGIGANVIVFGVLNAMILHPLNIPNPDRLMEIANEQPGDDNQSYPDFLDYKARNSTFSDMAAYRMGLTGLSTAGSAQITWNFEVSTNYFDMLGVQPQIGRFFHPNDEHGPNSAPYIVLSDSLWHNRFNADPRVIGTTVDLNKHPFTILGVAPKDFHGTELFFWPEFWMPMVNEEQVEGYSFITRRSSHGIFVIGSLKPGVNARQAQDNLNAIAHQMKRENPTDDDTLVARLVKPGLLGDTLGGPAKPFLAALMGLALLVLAAACVNLAGVFAARSADRSRELAIRLSIGSSRWRILRQLLTEAVLISLAGGLLGTMLSVFMLRALSHWQPISEYPIHVTVAADATTYALALALSLAAGILPGLLPARQVWRTDVSDALKSGSNSAKAIHRITLRDLLLGIQIALCALLVTASLVAVRGMNRSLHAPFGFVPSGVMIAQTDMHMAGYANKSALPVQRQILNSVSQIPGVTDVAIINALPLSGSGSNWSVYKEGTADLRASNSIMTPRVYQVTPGYIRAARTALLQGRDFTWDDGPQKPNVAIVNSTFARKMFGDRPAVGLHFLGGDKTKYEIVGVVENGKYEMLTEDPSPAMFFPLAQIPDATTNVLVRSNLSSAESASALNRALTSIDPNLPFNFRGWSDRLSPVLFPARIATASLGVMGLLAAMLAITGIFGMAAYTVSRRLRELGIRIALGALRGQLIRAALARPFLVLISGSLAGLILGVLASRLLAALVYEASPRDPLVLLGAVASMVLIGLIATWIPARRALSINPAQLLRQD
ncbi:ABC transporter permease [Occallatibacter savannae]|uniref:ABC transporter permease n=1 Tax=Occallatibacter savannae TaxID=1002691 RepID=UPI000D695822|nr:ABC transporter permease [Occallatibacter savannae]